MHLAHLSTRIGAVSIVIALFVAVIAVYIIAVDSPLSNGMGGFAIFVAAIGIAAGVAGFTYKNYYVRRRALLGVCLCVAAIIIAIVLSNLSTETYMRLYEWYLQIT